MILALLAALLAEGATTAARGGAAFYLDCAGGSDAASGLSPATAWRTPAKLSQHVFAPGDTIYLRHGSVCSGELRPKGSGTATAPITLDAWGTGPPPQVRAARSDKAALELFDQQYWTVQHLEFSGGQRYGIYVSGSAGVLHGIHIRDVIVHDVTGIPKSKESGLVVVTPGSVAQRFDDVVIDGVTAYRTSQWAGILVGGAAFGFPPESARSTNVVVRNCTVHDVAGDGIVLFEVNHGLIENSVVWYSGMQETETIGTPNAIWTWMCRDCAVRRNEAFLTDSPGIDGGAFDIDYGDADNIVEENYGHDTQGYCIAVLGAGWVTENSIVRNNVCADNGRSPRLARRQGAIFLWTWNGGKLKGVELSGNRIFWNPPVAAAALVSAADFIGEGKFHGNTIQSTPPLFIRSNRSLLLDHNTYEYRGDGGTRWDYGGKLHSGFRDYQRATGQDAHSRELRLPVNPAVRLGQTGTRGWTLTALISASPDDRDSGGQVNLIESVHRQFPALAIRIVSSANRALRLRDPAGRIVWRHDGPATPGDLGLAVRSFLGDPDYAQMTLEQ